MNKYSDSGEPYRWTFPATSNRAYDEGWERIFGKKHPKDACQCKPCVKLYKQVGRLHWSDCAVHAGTVEDGVGSCNCTCGDGYMIPVLTEINQEPIHGSVVLCEITEDLEEETP